MSPRIVPMDRHLLGRLIEAERDDLTAELCAGSEYADRVMTAASHGLAFAMIDGGEVPVGGGLFMRWAGCGEAWWLVSRSATRRQLAHAAMFSREFLAARQRHPAFRRIECHVLAHQPWSCFAASIGFVQEGFHRAFDPLGRDYLSYARVA